MTKKILILSLLLATLSLPLIAQDGLQLPAKIGEWETQNEVDIYVGDDLYLYINGGAELYHENGFIQVSAVDYYKGDESLAVEIYEMDRSAFGIFSILSGDTPDNISIGNSGIELEYYLLFWSGKVLVAITAHSEFPERDAAIREIAKGIASLTTPAAKLPDYTQRIPGGAVPGTLKLFAGSLALLNSSEEIAGLVSGFEEAVVADFAMENKEVFELYFFKFSSVDRATEALRKAEKAESERLIIRQIADEIIILAGEGSELQAHFDALIRQ
jgi:hypothetical protein